VVWDLRACAMLQVFSFFVQTRLVSRVDKQAEPVGCLDFSSESDGMFYCVTATTSKVRDMFD
jgi:hypothetical protein